MTIFVHNTLTRQKEEFIPQDPSRVTIYVCGPTVYSYAHIGNARPAVVFDVFVRLLREHYSRVVYARNLTDVDDKINAAAQAQGVPINVITEKFTAIYHQDMGALGVLPPDVEPRATEHIAQMIHAIEVLIESGFAYEAESHVLFNVPAYADYGALSGRNREDMLAGARVEVAPYKRDPADFVLWKPSSAGQPGWDSPWGRGRPGWHLECTAMIEQHLGETIDVHGGGQDLIFPHHENEIAQGTCVHHGTLYCRYWMHNGFVNVDQEKMSKSIGNVLLVHELLEDAPGEAIRYALLSTHYRSPLDWTDELLYSSKKSLDRLYGVLEELSEIEVPPKYSPDAEKLMAALCDDLNTPLALSELHAVAKRCFKAGTTEQKAQLKSALLFGGQLLGLLQGTAADWFQRGSSSELSAKAIESLLEQRRQAREQKNFALADQIRDELTSAGIEILDKAEGTAWRRV